MKAPIPKITFTQINQICIVVRDVRAAMRQYWDTVGIGPWKLYTVGGPDLSLAYMSYHGQSSRFKFYMALANTENIQFELIQPLEGKTIYQDFLDTHGEGVQHLGMAVDDIDQEMANAEANGVAVIQWARGVGEGKRGHAYLDTEGCLHTTFEFIQKPGESSRPAPEPDEVYPEGM